MLSRDSDQDVFAANLEGQCRGGTALYHPLEFRPHWGRVGDIGFFDSKGKYIWIHNAFHTEDLRRLNWPEFTAEEHIVVTESSHESGCRIAVGGSATITKHKFEASAKANTGGETSCRFSLEVSEGGGTMSVLILGDDPLKYRRCEGEYAYDLKDWFAYVEMHAWARVDAYHERPKQIFLVLGQDLTTSYAITHKKHCSLKCEVILEANVGIPSIVEAKALGIYGIKRAQASIGFENVVTKTTDINPTEYSIFLHAYTPKSGPIQRFKRTLKSRVEEQYKFFFEKQKTAKPSSFTSGPRFIKLQDNGTTAQDARPQKVAMEYGDLCKWYILRIGNDFGVQYCGHIPDEFKPDLDDDELLNIVLTMRRKMSDKKGTDDLFENSSGPLAASAITLLPKPTLIPESISAQTTNMLASKDPPSAASQEGSETVVRLLLENRADVNARDYGVGLSELQPYCAGCSSGIPIPASHTHFNYRPTLTCRTNHPGLIRFVMGCSIHRGILDQCGQCSICLYERYYRVIVPLKPLQNTIGYPNDDRM